MFALLIIFAVLVLFFDFFSTASTFQLLVAVTFGLLTAILSENLYAKYSRTKKTLLKETKALNKMYSIIQEVTPHYFQAMSMLEKSQYEIRLSRLEIGISGLHKDSSSNYLENEFSNFEKKK